MNTLSRLLSTALLAGVLTIPSRAVEAQMTAGIRPGDEVRVSYYDPYAVVGYGGPGMVIGEVVDLNESGILLRRGKRLTTVPASSIRSVELRVGTKPASAPEMVIGSALGFVSGFALGAATGGFNHMDPNLDRVEAGLTTGVLIGAPLGAFVAWLNSRSRGIYEDVPFGDVLSSLVVGTSGVGFSIPTGGGF